MCVCAQTLKSCLIGIFVVINIVKLTPIQYNTIHYNTIQYKARQYNTIQYNAMQWNATQRNATQHNTTSFIFSRLQSINNISWWAAIVRIPHWRLYEMADIVQTFWNALNLFYFDMQISLTSVCKGQVDNKLALVHASAWFGQATSHWLKH